MNMAKRGIKLDMSQFQNIVNKPSPSEEVLQGQSNEILELIYTGKMEAQPNAPRNSVDHFRCLRVWSCYWCRLAVAVRERS